MRLRRGRFRAEEATWPVGAALTYTGAYAAIR